MSTSRELPSASTIVLPSMCEIASVTSSTFGCVNAGYQEFEISTRLQPRLKSGVSLRRSSRSRTCLRRCSLARRSAGCAIFGCLAKPRTSVSRPQYTAVRTMRWASGIRL